MNAVMHTNFELKERGQSKGLSGILYVQYMVQPAAISKRGGFDSN